MTDSASIKTIISISESLKGDTLREIDMFYAHANILISYLTKQEKKIENYYRKLKKKYHLHYDFGLWEQAIKDNSGGTGIHPEYQRNAVVAGHCILIYHVFEQFLKEAVMNDEKVLKNLYKLRKLKKIDEFRLASNVCKHGEGSSSKYLRAMRLSFFRKDGVFPIYKAKPLGGREFNFRKKELRD